MPRDGFGSFAFILCKAFLRRERVREIWIITLTRMLWHRPAGLQRVVDPQAHVLLLDQAMGHGSLKTQTKQDLSTLVGKDELCLANMRCWQEGGGPDMLDMMFDQCAG